MSLFLLLISKNNVSLTSEELQAAYRNATSTKPPEERLTSHILIEENDSRTLEEARVLAQSLKERIDAGAMLDDLAREFSG